MSCIVTGPLGATGQTAAVQEVAVSWGNVTREKQQTVGRALTKPAEEGLLVPGG